MKSSFRTGKLHSTLSGHQDEIFVLEPHPISSYVLLSSAHDGLIMVWDLATSQCLFKYRNMVDDQSGHAAVYDAKWSPDGLTVCASDSHGHLLFIGHGCSEKYDRLPVELFFHTDYRPLLRDSYHNVVDEQTQVPPHLLPPPFLVDSEGSPYPAYIQKVVPGREKMSERDALLPGAPEPTFNLDNQQQQQQQLQNGAQPPAPAAGQPLALPGPSGLNNAPAAANDNLANPMPGPSRRLRSPERSDTDNSNPEFRLDRNPDEAQGQRQPQQQQQQQGTTTAASVKTILRKNDARANKIVSDHLQNNETYSILENARYSTECKKVWFDHDYASQYQSKKDKKGKVKSSAGRGGRSGQAPAGGQHPRRAVAAEEEDDDDDDEQNADNDDADTSDCSIEESDFSSAETTTEASSEHSDWGSDDSKEEEVQPHVSQRQRRRAASGESPGKKKSPRNKKKRGAAQRCRENMLHHPEGIPDEYTPSPWLSEVMPRKSPYFPQIGDIVVYFKHGHEKYLDLVRTRKVYNVNMKEQEWSKRKHVTDPAIVKVLHVNFVIRPPRLCVLRLALLNPHTLEPSGETFTIKYHDMNDVVDFLVLFSTYKACTARGGAGGISGEGRNWKHGDRIRCMIDDCWWKGTVNKIEYQDANKRSPFLSIYCHWDNGEKEQLSPWDVEALDEDTAEIPDGTPVTAAEAQKAASLYQPTDDEWNGIGRETDSRRITEALGAVMELAIAEPFNFPVDLTAYAEYMLDVEYPMDLSLIKARLENKFYRRTAALEYDISYIHSNAASFNRPKSDIVRNAKIIMRVLMQIVNDPSKNVDDVSTMYHREVQNFEWSSSDESEEEEGDAGRPGTSSSSSRRRRRKSSSSKSSPPHLNPKKWKHDCNVMLNEMVQLPFSYPFREPVSEIQFPDYHRFVSTPMDLSTVRESLMIGDYSSPTDFEKDIRLIFKNSKAYNTEPRSKILAMTDKLEEWFNENFPEIIRDYRKVRSKLAHGGVAGSPSKKSKSKRHDRPGSRSSGAEFKGKGKGKGKGQSNKIKKRRRHSDYDDEEDETEDEEEMETTPSSPPAHTSSRSGRRIRSSRAVTYSEDDADDDEPSPVKSRALSKSKRANSEPAAAATTSTLTTPAGGSRPPRGASGSNDPTPSTSSSGGSSIMSGRRLSSRVPKPPVRYRDNLGQDEEDEDATPFRRTVSQRSTKPTTGTMKEQSGEEEESDGENAGGDNVPAEEAAEGSSSSRPRRHRKPLRKEIYKYNEGKAKTKPVKEEAMAPSPRKAATVAKRTLSSPEPTPAKKKRNASGKEEEDDDDDVPLARKLGAKIKQEHAAAPPATPKKEAPAPVKSDPAAGSSSVAHANGAAEAVIAAPANVVSPSKRPVRAASLKKKKDEDEDFEATDDEEEEEEEEETPEESSEDDRPLRRKKGAAAKKKPSSAPKRRAATRYRSDDDEDEDVDDDDEDEDFDPKGRSKKKSRAAAAAAAAATASPSKSRSSRQRRGGYRDEYDDNSDFIADDSDDEEEEEESEEEEEEALDESEEDAAPRRSKGGRVRPQRRATLQPKANSSKRAAQALDSENEHTSARRPSRLRNRNEAAGGSGGSARSGGRRRAAKRSYYEGDEDEDFEDAGAEGGDSSSQENRRPRRAASKRAKFRETSDEEEEARRPNPRII